MLALQIRTDVGLQLLLLSCRLDRYAASMASHEATDRRLAISHEGLRKPVTTFKPIGHGLSI